MVTEAFLSPSFLAGASLSPGTPTIPLTQLQPHSLALPSQQGPGTAGQLQQAQQTVFRFPARAGGQIVSLTGQHSLLLRLLQVGGDAGSCGGPGPDP